MKDFLLYVTMMMTRAALAIGSSALVHACSVELNGWPPLNGVFALLSSWRIAHSATQWWCVGHRDMDLKLTWPVALRRMKVGSIAQILWLALWVGILFGHHIIPVLILMHPVGWFVMIGVFCGVEHLMQRATTSLIRSQGPR